MLRSEEDKLLRAPLVVVLGGQEYKIQPLVIKEARGWRQKFAGLLGKLPAYAKVTTDDAEGFQGAMNAMMVAMPDEMTDLFFAYAKDLDKEDIESTATEAEMAVAIDALMEVAFPLVGSMTRAMSRLAR